MDGRMNGWIDGWKTQLYILLTVCQSYQSYHDDGWIINKGRAEWNPCSR